MLVTSRDLANMLPPSLMYGQLPQVEFVRLAEQSITLHQLLDQFSHRMRCHLPAAGPCGPPGAPSSARLAAKRKGCYILTRRAPTFGAQGSNGSFASFLPRTPDVHLSPDSGGIADISQPLLGANSGLVCRSTKSSYSMTSSAMESKSGGIVSPRALAVCMLITNWNLVGCKTGRSLVFSPFSIRAT